MCLLSTWLHRVEYVSCLVTPWSQTILYPCSVTVCLLSTWLRWVESACWLVTPWFQHYIVSISACAICGVIWWCGSHRQSHLSWFMIIEGSYKRRFRDGMKAPVDIHTPPTLLAHSHLYRRPSHNRFSRLHECAGVCVCVCVCVAGTICLLELWVKIRFNKKW